jgi:hypothetical protein
MFMKIVCKCQKTYYARAKGLINVKLKIENGKWKINVGKTVRKIKCNVFPTVLLI